MSKSERIIKAIFEVTEDSNLAAVYFKTGKKRIDWRDLTGMEQMHMLNAWEGHYRLFAKFLKGGAE